MADWKKIEDGGSWRKWEKPGDSLEGIYLETTTEESKFGSPQTVLKFCDPDDEETIFKCNAPAVLARQAKKFEKGCLYRVEFTGEERTKAGNRIKTFNVFQSAPGAPF